MKGQKTPYRDDMQKWVVAFLEKNSKKKFRPVEILSELMKEEKLKSLNRDLVYRLIINLMMKLENDGVTKSETPKGLPVYRLHQIKLS